jgi:uncharacterized membrane protein (DUF4010 family)
MPAELSPLQLAARLALALGLALFAGLAFEEAYKREEHATPGGVRTFPMLTLAGAMLYLIEPRQAFAFIAGLLALALWHFTYLRSAPGSPGATSLMIPVSNLIAYLIGPLALTQAPWVAVAAAVTAVLLVGTRERLHRLVEVVPQDELLTAGKFLILVGIILPLVPNEPVLRETPLTPYHVWLAVVAICTLSYLTYLLQMFTPARNASLLPAVLGGACSSTATTIVLAKRQREAGGDRAELAAGIVAATAVMYLRLGVIIALFDARLAWTLAPPLAALFVFGAALAAYEWRRCRGQQPDANLQIPAVNPLQIPTAITFAVIFVVISMLTEWIRTAFGQTGLLVLAALVGITDIDPFVINIAQGGASGLSTAVLSAAILIAASANNVAKATYALGFGGVQSSRRSTSMLLALAVAGFAAAAIYVPWQTQN